MKKKFLPAIKGLFIAIQDSSIRLQLIFALITLVVALLVHASFIELLFILSAIATVVIAEMFNTCIEKVCDLYTKEKNEQIKNIKDLAAGTVLFSAIYAVCVAIIIIFIHYGGK